MEAGAAFTCPHCGREVPRERFCVSCGEPLGSDGGRRGFAAAPGEHWAGPRIVSSIFPHLPRTDMRSFRIALAVGVGLVLVLCLLGLYPLALVAAAVEVPLLFLLYLWDVDVYEEEPLIVLAFTTAWGALFGALLGWAAKQLASQASLLQGSADTHNLVWLGIVLPCAALALAIAGPLILLPYRKFNDVLDGVTFGACCAATLLAAEAIANSADFLHLGFRAAGNEWLWLARLLTLAVATPVLAAGAGGAVCGAFWLRFRAPAHERRVLGPFGSPFLAVPIAAAAFIGAAVAGLYLKQWETLIVTAALAAAALVWLRWTIEVGLRQEAAERPIGPPVECPNCHASTPAHTFCGNCGIALRALPKPRTAHGELPPTRTRIGAGARIAVFSALAAGAIGLAAVAIALTRPAATGPPCEPGVPCAAPPPSVPVAAPHLLAGVFASGTSWRSTRGPGLRYAEEWHVVKKSDNGIVLQASGDKEFVVVVVLVAPSSVSPQAALQSQVSSQPDGFLGVQRDGSSAHVILMPELGYVRGVAAMYSATVDQSPSPTEKVELAFEAARHGGSTVVVEAITDEAPQSNSESSPFPAFAIVDELLDTFDWGTG